jgi:hypothetical protein|tara:strand:+ start:525 stop:773 length:249 start_codon:yes stop_codon:yes gene_type:complete
MTKDDIKSSFLTKAKMTKILEQTVLEKRMPYLDAILHVCEEQGIEPDEVNKFISPVIKGKLEAEARELNLLAHDSVPNTLPL